MQMQINERGGGGVGFQTIIWLQSYQKMQSAKAILRYFHWIYGHLGTQLWDELMEAFLPTTHLAQSQELWAEVKK